MSDVLPISGIVPTGNRSRRLQQTFESLAQQSAQPAEIIVIDASRGDKTEILCRQKIADLQSQIRYVVADVRGAATQRNQGVTLATQPVILFFDDDIVFKPDCILRLWHALQSDQQLGGLNAMILNQNYRRPGIVSRMMFTLLNGAREKSFAGRVIGPAVNLLPENRQDLPEVVPVEWLNTTSTLYRREALPDPPFRAEFTGYSLMEDLALSLEVAKQWKLANARTARIVHDSRPADYKSDEYSRSRMELVNRHLIMTQIMGRRGLIDYTKLALWELFSLASAVADRTRRRALLYILRGKWRAVRQIGRERAGQSQEQGG